VTEGAFDPRGFYRVALEVAAAHREDESYRRTAVARAYYACFHLARRGLERGGRWSPGTVNVHERVLQELVSRRRTGIANGLRVLRRLREHADYDLARPVDRALADDALTKAAALVGLLDNF
jgi:hypothetical protein